MAAPFGLDTASKGQDHDRAWGIALAIVGVLAGWAHLGIRSALKARDLYDEPVERAFEALVAVLAGLAAISMIGIALAQVVERSTVDYGEPSPGGMIAVAAGATLLWAIYAWRVVRNLDLGLARLPRDSRDDG